MNKAKFLPWMAATFVVGILAGFGGSEYRHYHLNLEKSAYDATVDLIADLAMIKALESKNIDLAKTLVLNSIRSAVENVDKTLGEIKNPETKRIMQDNIELGKKLLNASN